jgi:Cys-tRNA(Pro)/Cys-tRNA(Cys) deacylase
MKKAFPTFIQEDAELLERISVSAGARGCQVILAVDALVKCTRASFAELCRS